MTASQEGCIVYVTTSKDNLCQLILSLKPKEKIYKIYLMLVHHGHAVAQLPP
jgi:hypothetical protein